LEIALQQAERAVEERDALQKRAKELEHVKDEALRTRDHYAEQLSTSKGQVRDLQQRLQNEANKVVSGSSRVSPSSQSLASWSDAKVHNSSTLSSLRSPSWEDSKVHSGSAGTFAGAFSALRSPGWDDAKAPCTALQSTHQSSPSPSWGEKVPIGSSETRSALQSPLQSTAQQSTAQSALHSPVSWLGDERSSRLGSRPSSPRPSSPRPASPRPASSPLLGSATASSAVVSDSGPTEVALPEGYATVLLEIERSGWDAMEWEKGFTLLHWAAKNGCPQLCEKLLGHGADARAIDEGCRSAFDYARERGCSRTIEALERGALATSGSGTLRGSSLRSNMH